MVSEQMFLYKILTLQQWKTAQEQQRILRASEDKDFIHFSTSQQVEYVVGRFFSEEEVVVLKIQANALPGKLVLEQNSGEGGAFYHLYTDKEIPYASIVDSRFYRKGEKFYST